MATRKKKVVQPNTSAIAQAFSHWLQATREKLGLSRYALAKAGWVKDSTLKALEDRGHDPKLSTFVAACQGLGQNPSTVLAKLLKEVE